jgi:hypothetical protein
MYPINQMDKEVMEHELVLMAGNVITVVRPYFGTQSDSWIGELMVHSEYPIKFEMRSPTHSLLFTIEDVASFQDTSNLSIRVPYKAIIRLQGPDYVIPSTTT